MIQEIQSLPQSQSSDKKGADGGTPTKRTESSLHNKGMDELREEFELKKSAPKKLRGICKSYRKGGLLEDRDGQEEEEEEERRSLLEERK